MSDVAWKCPECGHPTADHPLRDENGARYCFRIGGLVDGPKVDDPEPQPSLRAKLQPEARGREEESLSLDAEVERFRERITPYCHTQQDLDRVVAKHRTALTAILSDPTLKDLQLPSFGESGRRSLWDETAAEKPNPIAELDRRVGELERWKAEIYKAGHVPAEILTRRTPEPVPQGELRRLWWDETGGEHRWGEPHARFYPVASIDENGYVMRVSGQRVPWATDEMLWPLNTYQGDLDDFRALAREYFESGKGDGGT